MPAETEFLLPRMYELLWEAPRFLTKTKLTTYIRHEHKPHLLQQEMAEATTQSPDVYAGLFDNYEGVERDRIIGVVRDTFLQVIKPDFCRQPKWGFKEIWNGLSANNYD